MCSIQHAVNDKTEIPELTYNSPKPLDKCDKRRNLRNMLFLHISLRQAFPVIRRVHRIAFGMQTWAARIITWVVLPMPTPASILLDSNQYINEQTREMTRTDTQYIYLRLYVRPVWRVVQKLKLQVMARTSWRANIDPVSVAWQNNWGKKLSTMTHLTAMTPPDIPAERMRQIDNGRRSTLMRCIINCGTFRPCESTKRRTRIQWRNDCAQLWRVSISY